MSNPLVEAIREVVSNSPEFKSVSSRVPSLFGQITLYNENTNKVSIAYADPATGFEKTKADVDVSCFRGIHNGIEIGDTVIINFPYGYSELPVIQAIIPADGEKNIMAGYMSTNISKGC